MAKKVVSMVPPKPAGKVEIDRIQAARDALKEVGVARCSNFEAVYAVLERRYPGEFEDKNTTTLLIENSRKALDEKEPGAGWHLENQKANTALFCLRSGGTEQAKKALEEIGQNFAFRLAMSYGSAEKAIKAIELIEGELKA